MLLRDQRLDGSGGPDTAWVIMAEFGSVDRVRERGDGDTPARRTSACIRSFY